MNDKFKTVLFSIGGSVLAIFMTIGYVIFHIFDLEKK